MNVKFRKMNTDDRDEVLEMMRTFYSSPAVYTDGSEEIFLKDIENCVNNSPYLEGYVFELDEEICGYSMLAKSFSTEFGKPCVWVEDIFIKENSRGKGIGKKFFDFISSRYTDVIFRLEVEKENKSAVHLYRKSGYGFLPYLEMKK